MGLNFGSGLLRRLRYAYTQSETKLTIIIALWALAHRIFPAVPIELPSMDLGGLGTITPSLATLGVYVIGRCLFKGATDGEFPFVPSEAKVKELEAESQAPPPAVPILFALAALVLVAGQVSAEPRLSFARFSVAAGAGVHGYESGEEIVGDYEVHGVLSYRATTDFGVHANPEYGIGRDNGTLRLGGHLTLARSDPWRVSVGYDAISHFGAARSNFNDGGHGPFAIASKAIGEKWAAELFVNEDFKNGAAARVAIRRHLGGGVK